MTRRRYRQLPDGGGLVEIFNSDNASVSASIHKDIEPFKSPIDGSAINTRSQLEAHNKRHGVSNDLDSLRERSAQYLKSQHVDTAVNKRERIAKLVEAYDRASSPDFSRRKQYDEDSQLQ